MTINVALNKWDLRFLEMAQSVAQWSKDPSTKVGVVIVRPDHSIVSTGYNGFARGVEDSFERYNDRPIKYEMVVHAEANAIISARTNLEGCTLYGTLFPCSRCAALIINTGIKRVITPFYDISKNDYSHQLSYQQFNEAGVEILMLKDCITDQQE